MYIVLKRLKIAREQKEGNEVMNDVQNPSRPCCPRWVGWIGTNAKKRAGTIIIP